MTKKLFAKDFGLKIWHMAPMICLFVAPCVGSESEKEASRLLEAADILTDEVRVAGAPQIQTPDDRETEDKSAHSEAEFQRGNEKLHRMTTELSGLVKKLQALRERQAKEPDDEGLRGEIAQVKTEYLHKLRHYNSARIPQNKLLYEGDLPAEEMPWERGDGGAELPARRPGRADRPH